MIRKTPHVEIMPILEEWPMKGLARRVVVPLDKLRERFPTPPKLFKDMTREEQKAELHWRYWTAAHAFKVAAIMEDKDGKQTPIDPRNFYLSGESQ